jgi:hypothetical protein
VRVCSGLRKLKREFEVNKKNVILRAIIIIDFVKS